MEGIRSVLRELIGTNNTLITNVLFIRYTGSHSAALLLSQMWYWQERTPNPDTSYFAKSHVQWKDEIWIEQKSLQRTTIKFKEMGILETEVRKFAGTPTVHYRLNVEEVIKQLAAFCANEIGQNEQMDMVKMTKSEWSKRPNPLTDTITDTITEKREKEQNEKNTRPPVKKPAKEKQVNLKPTAYFQNELLNNPEQMAKVRTWCAEAAKEKISQSLSVFRHTYTEQQLNAYCEHYATILDVPVYKTMFTQTGDIISCDLVHHIINKAKFELENKGKINIPLPQMTAAAIKQRAVDVDPFTKHFQKTSK